MESTRRDVLTAAVTVAGATATHDLAHADDHAHSDVPSDVALRVKSLESLLVEKGLVNQAALDALIDIYEYKVGPRKRRAGGSTSLGRSGLQTALARQRHRRDWRTRLFR